MDTLETWSIHNMLCKNCLNDLLRTISNYRDLYIFYALDQTLSHPWHYEWCEQAILQDYPGGLSMVRGTTYDSNAWSG